MNNISHGVIKFACRVVPPFCPHETELLPTSWERKCTIASFRSFVDVRTNLLSLFRCLKLSGVTTSCGDWCHWRTNSNANSRHFFWLGFWDFPFRWELKMWSKTRIPIIGHRKLHHNQTPMRTAQISKKSTTIIFEDTQKKERHLSYHTGTVTKVVTCWEAFRRIEHYDEKAGVLIFKK